MNNIEKANKAYNELEADKVQQKLQRQQNGPNTLNKISQSPSLVSIELLMHQA